MEEPRPPASSYSKILYLFLTILNMFMCWNLFNILKPHTRSTDGSTVGDRRFNPFNTYEISPDSQTCGSSLEDAITNGCIFDAMGASWVPSLCYDKELAESALSNDTSLAKIGGSGPWPWYEDQNFTRVVETADLWSMADGQSWTWETYHVAHCLYEWRTLARAMERVMKGERMVFIHDKAVDVKHVDHCNEVIANQNMRRGAKSLVSFGYRACIRLDIE